MKDVKVIRSFKLLSYFSSVDSHCIIKAKYLSDIFWALVRIIFFQTFKFAVGTYGFQNSLCHIIIYNSRTDLFCLLDYLSLQHFWD